MCITCARPSCPERRRQVHVCLCCGAFWQLKLGLGGWTCSGTLKSQPRLPRISLFVGPLSAYRDEHVWPSAGLTVVEQSGSGVLGFTV